MNTITVYVDGGAHNNGIPEAKCYGSIAVEYKGEIKKHETYQYPGARTNNQAEYDALLSALDYLNKLRLRASKPLPPIVIKSDSTLVVNQVNGNWKIKDADLKDSYILVREYLDKSGLNINITKVPRDEIVKVLGH